MDARHFFAHPEYGTRPERATHGLVVPIPAGARGLAAVAGLLVDGTPVRAWSQTVAVARRHHLAAQLRKRELHRPVPGAGVRPVLLGYADGRADLVLTAHRTALDAAGLDRLARELTGTTPRTLSVPAASEAPWSAPAASGALWSAPAASGVPWSAPVAPAPAFGLGDGARARRYARAEMGTVRCPRPEPARLLAATALVLARYGEPATIGVVNPGGRDGRDTVTIPLLEVADGDTIDALTRRAAAGLTGDPNVDRLPAVGVLLPGPDPAVRYESAGPPFPITVAWRWRPDGHLTGHCLFDEAYLSPSVAAGFAGQLIRTAGELATRSPSMMVAGVDVMTAAEVAKVLDAGRTPPPADRRAGTVHAAFAAVARRQPDAPACTDGGTTLTYRELSERAGVLAAAMRDRGAAPGTRVGVCLDRGADLVTVLLAVLMTGAAYVPVDVRAPADRLAFTVQDARPVLVVTDVAGFPTVDGVPLVSPDALRTAGSAAVRAGADAPAGGPDDPAYVIYTSGSTGRPRASSCRTATSWRCSTPRPRTWGSDPADVWSLFHSSAFDFSVWEIWGCLLTGGRLVCVPYWVSRSNPEEFHELLARERVTVLSQTPSAFAQLHDAEAARASRPTWRYGWWCSAASRWT
jgi:hypothetical protein